VVNRYLDARALAPYAILGLAFGILFWRPIVTLGHDWWADPEAGHGLLLGPLAFWMMWKSGRAQDAREQPTLGLFIIACSILVRYLSGLAAELFTMRLSLFGAACGVVIMYSGVRQLVRWWLPVTLLFLSIPLPSVLTGTIALPLQFQASRLGAAMLEMRHVPVRLAGNVIRIPNNTLFVTEACSGLRSLTALLALGILIGGLWLKYPLSRIILVALTIPVAIILNGVRVFLTGFLIHFVDRRLGEGFMHLTEGWLIFVVAFAILGGMAWVVARAEHRYQMRGTA
jgi:exosortase